jgi:hypothetical protein
VHGIATDHCFPVRFHSDAEGMSVQQINQKYKGEHYEIKQTRQSRRHVSRSEG